MMKKSKVSLFVLVILSSVGLVFLVTSSVIAAAPPGTISYWKLDETPTGTPPTSPVTYIDSIPVPGNDGEDNGNPPTPTAGQVNGAQQFDGAATGIDIPADSSYDWGGDESFSIELWLNQPDPLGSDNEVFVGRDAPGNVQWFVGIWSTTSVPGRTPQAAAFGLRDSNGVQALLSGTTVLTDGEWHHIVAIRDADAGAAGQNLLYVDGEMVPEDTEDVAYTGNFAAAEDLNIGYLNRDATPEFFTDGAADEIALYNRALTSQEVNTHYLTGLAGKGIEDVGVPEIIGNWDDGIKYWDEIESEWTQMTAEVTTGDIAAGDFNGDGFEDVASSWADYGLWYQDGSTLEWFKIDDLPPDNVTAGDVTGDGRDEIVGTWSTGIWYYDFVAEDWTQMTPDVGAGDIAAGDFNGDGFDDVASSWADYGLWYQDGDTLEWTKIDNLPPSNVTAGDVTGDGPDEIIGIWSNGIWYYDFVAEDWTQMTPDVGAGDIAAGDFNGDGFADVASTWTTSGLWYQDGATSDWTEIDDSPSFRVTAGDVTGQ